MYESIINEYLMIVSPIIDDGENSEYFILNNVSMLAISEW
jgi:hypothetical protein